MTDITVKSKSRRLSAIIEADSFFYGIFDASYRLLFSERKSFESCLTYVDYLSTLRSIPFLKDEYDAVNICCKSNKQRFYPASLDTDLHSDNNFSSIVTDTFINQDVTVAWSENDALLSAVQDIFPGQKIYHISTVLSDYLYPTHRNTLLAHFDKERLYILHYTEGTFKFFNAFKAMSANDFLYFIMQAYEVNGLDPAKDTLDISGDLFVESQMYKTIKRYVKNVDFVHPQLFKLKESMPESVKHRYFDLYANTICG